ncbi:hypothetical protein JCM5350_002948 [Sporobolomyces pararoseus]
MTNPKIQCKACQKTPTPPDSPDDKGSEEKFLVCSRCQTMTKGIRKTYYCSKSCQILDWPLHKPTICGKLPLEEERQSPTVTNETTTNLTDLSPIDTSSLPPALVFHLAALKTISTQLPTPPPPPPAETETAFSPQNKRPPLHPIPAYLFFPSSPLSPSSSSSSSSSLPIPIHLTKASHSLFTLLFHTSIKTSNPLSITLMYSLLIVSVSALSGTPHRLIEQLSEEFPGVDVEGLVEKDLEPSEQELSDAIGGEQNLPLLLAWQMEEAERLRQQ